MTWAASFTAAHPESVSITRNILVSDIMPGVGITHPRCTANTVHGSACVVWRFSRANHSTCSSAPRARSPLVVWDLPAIDCIPEIPLNFVSHHVIDRPHLRSFFRDRETFRLLAAGTAIDQVACQLLCDNGEVRRGLRCTHLFCSRCLMVAG